MVLHVRAEAVVRRRGGPVEPVAPAGGPLRSPVSPSVVVEPAGEHSAHLVDPATGRARCGLDAEGMFVVDQPWAGLRAFYRCPRCES